MTIHQQPKGCISLTFFITLSTLISLILTLIIITPKFAASEIPNQGLVFREWHYHGDTWQFENSIYTLLVDETDYKTIALKKDQKTMLINKNTCYHEGVTSYCYVNVSDEQDFDHIMFDSQGRKHLGVDITIFRLSPDLIISHSVQKPSLELYESTNVHVTIKNTGTKTAETLHCKDLITNADILNAYNANIENNNIIFETSNLKKDKSVTYSYKIKSIDYKDITLKTYCNYSFENENATKDSSTTTISVPSPYSVTHSLNPSSIDIGDLSTYEFVISNLEDTPMSLNLTVLVPSSLVITKYNNKLSRTSIYKYRKFLFTGIIKPESSQSFSITFKALKTGTYIINSSAFFTVNNKNFTSKTTKTLTVTTGSVSLITGLSKNSVVVGDDMDVDLFITNNDNKNFYNISGYITSPVFNKSFSLNALAAGDSIKLLSFSIKAPNIENITTFDVNAFVKYQTLTNQWLDSSAQDSFTVYPLEQSLTITKTANKHILSPGDNFTVIVKAKRFVDSLVEGLTITERLPLNLEKLSGLTLAQPSLSSGEEKQVYIYNARVSGDYKRESLQIPTVLRAVVNGIKLEKLANLNLTINISKTEVNLTNITTNKTINKTVSNNTKEEKGIVKSVSKHAKNLFETIINFFKNLF